MRIRALAQVRLAVVFIALFVTSLLPAAAAGSTAADFYVAPNGKDSWSGKLAAPNATGADGPFATLGHAREAVRALKSAGGLKAPITARAGASSRTDCVAGCEADRQLSAAFPAQPPTALHPHSE